MRTTAIAGLLLLASACALDETAPEERPLDRLRARTNAYTSFHYKAELSDGTLVVPIELAWRAPDRALLRYGPNFTVILSGGVVHSFERRSYASVNLAEMMETLRKTYGDILPSPPEPAFALAGWERPISSLALMATIEVRPLGARLGWLDDLATWLVDGSVYRKGAIELVLRDDGFIESVQIAHTARFALKELAINQTVDDALFALPSVEGLIDISDGRRPQWAQELDTALHRWVLSPRRPDDAAIEALVKVDLARAYEPARLIEFQKKNLDDEVEAYRKQQPDARPLAVREKIEIARGKAMGGLEVMEEEIQKEFRRRLERTIGSRGPSESMARRWNAAVARQFDLQIRRPLDQLFSEKLSQ